MSVSPFHRGHEAAGSRDEQQTGHPGFFCSSHLSCSGLMSRAGSNPGQRWTGIFGSAPQRKQTNTREATACEGHPEGQEACEHTPSPRKQHSHPRGLPDPGRLP